MQELIGKRVGDYLIEESVGSGSAGHVFRARDEKRGQPVALKVIHPHLASQPAFRDKLLSSAGSITALQHQGIARVYQIGEADRQLFVASEWIQGETLGHVLQNGAQLGLRLGARVVQIAADALVYAHRQGVIHGGLQPSNVLLSPHGGELPWRPLLTDFQQASLVPGEPLPAVLPYLSPEQCDGKRPNGRSDVYALGIMLYHVCTGRLPFQPQSTRDVLAGGAPPVPRSLRPEIPTVLEAIILKAMARNTAERYRSMEEFLLFLRREVDKLPLDGAAPEPPPAPPPQPAVAPAPARPAPAAAPAIAGAAMAAPAPAVAVPAPASSSDADYLIIRHPRLEPQTFLLHKWLITIGLQRDNDLVLTGEGVAAKHARLERTDTGWNLIDMGSLNGTYLEGSQLLADMPEPWKPGQLVKLGEYTLEWRSGLAQKAPKAAMPPPVVDTGRLYMRMQPTQLTTHAGLPAQAVLEIENQTGRGLSVTLGVMGIPPQWVAVEPGLIHLSPQQKVVVPFTIQPPRHHSAAAGLHQFKMEARADKGAETAVTNGQLTIHPFSQVFAEIQPSPLRHGKAGEVKLVNEGNGRNRFSATVSDVDNEIVFEMSPTEVESMPGEAHTMRLIGRARKRPFFLRARLIPFELRVAGGPTAAPQVGRLLAPPILSIWLLLAILLPLLFILLFLSYTGGQDYADPCTGIFREGDLQEACELGPQAAVAATAVPTATATIEAPPTPTVLAVVNTPETIVVPPTAPPAGAERLVIGKSVNGEDIVAWKIGDGATRLLFVGGLYAGFSPDSIALAESLRVRLAASPELIPANVTVYIVPEWNPDSARGSGGRLNANGVDLNRNWSCGWQALDNNRAGSAALSEPESRALSEFISLIEPVAAVFWNTPASAGNAGKVSPGRCAQAQTAASRALADLYAGAVDGYSSDQADTGQRISGDATDSIADMGVPSIFVLLNSTAGLDAHLPAVRAILNTYGGE
ncbi:MAG: hypothetical protein BroJett015_15710 [Chloroflexota bacterium]|nr:MAG: hypothetical protein BroJett015_15710 [Chloroflexota bacterium]